MVSCFYQSAKIKSYGCCQKAHLSLLFSERIDASQSQSVLALCLQQRY